jgi:hypothetical protein
MSRQSTASLSVVPVEPVVRLQPPADLEPDEAALWRRVVDAKPADYFGDESAPVLAEYVRASVMADLLDKQVKTAIAGGEPAEIKAMLQLRDMESKRVLSIATKLRLTNQSRYTPQAAATASKKASGARPWQAK